MKKLLYTALAFAGSVPAVLAEGGTTATDATAITYSGSTAESIVNGASGTLQNFLTGAAGVVGAVIIAGLAIWGAIALVGIIKKAFSTGKGR